MRAFVFTDKALERYAGQFVWLAVDTENSANVAFLKKYPISVWPTLLVIDPKKETIAQRGHSIPILAFAERIRQPTSRRTDCHARASCRITARRSRRWRRRRARRWMIRRFRCRPMIAPVCTTRWSARAKR